MKGQTVLKTLSFMQIVAIIVIGSFLWAAEDPAVRVISFVVSLETNDWNLNMTNYVVCPAIGERVPIICSAAMAHDLASFHTGIDTRVLTDESQWTVFINSDSDIVVLLPVSYQETLLKQFGLAWQGTNLRRIAGAEFWNYFAQDQFYKKKINEISNFKKLFDLSNNLPKQIYLAGHGAEGIDLAGMPVATFKRFLLDLEDIKTRFLYVYTCFAGGTALLHLQEFPERGPLPRLSVPARLSYPIAFQATTDEETSHYIDAKFYFRSFFQRLFNYFSQKDWRSGKGLTNLLRPLYLATPHRYHRIPSIRLPGTNSFFRSINVEKMRVITYLDAKKKTLEYLFETRFVQGKRDKKGSFAYRTIIIDESIEYVLLYPCDLSEIDIKLERAPFQTLQPQFISKIPGPAQHFIGGIIADNLTIGEVANAFIPGKKNLIIPVGVAPKVFCISRLICKPEAQFVEYPHRNTNITGFIVEKPEKKLAQSAALALFCQKDRDGDTNYYVTCPFTEHIIWYEISASDYGLIAKRLLARTRALPQALYEATGGNENQETEDTARRQFCAAAGITGPFFEKDVYDQEEIKLVARSLISKNPIMNVYALRICNGLFELENSRHLRTIAQLVSQEPFSIDRLDVISEFADLLIKTDNSDYADMILRNLVTRVLGEPIAIDGFERIMTLVNLLVRTNNFDYISTIVHRYMKSDKWQEDDYGSIRREIWGLVMNLFVREDEPAFLLGENLMLEGWGHFKPRVLIVFIIKLVKENNVQKANRLLARLLKDRPELMHDVLQEFKKKNVESAAMQQTIDDAQQTIK